MTDMPGTSQGTVLIFVLALAVAGCAAMESTGPADAEFVTGEVEGSKVWRGGGTIDLHVHGSKPLILKVRNPLGADHGFSIDTMKVHEVIKAGEERIITVPLEAIDPAVSEHNVYCQLHPKHVPATLKIIGRDAPKTLPEPSRS